MERRHAGRAAFVLASALAAACTEGRVTQARAPSAPLYARIAVTARMTAQLAAQMRTLVVVATYARATGPGVLLPLDSTAATVAPGGGTDVPVQVNITACLADPAREPAPAVAAGAAVCLLHLDLVLLDAPGARIARAQVAVPASAGATVVAPTVTFTVNGATH